VAHASADFREIGVGPQAQRPVEAESEGFLLEENGERMRQLVRRDGQLTRRGKKRGRSAAKRSPRHPAVESWSRSSRPPLIDVDQVLQRLLEEGAFGAGFFAGISTAISNGRGSSG
jgi:hypothetical protein